MNYSININGIDVDATYSDKSIKEIFNPLLEHLTALQKEKGRRILVLLAAPPGAGKSTLVSFLQTLSEDHELLSDIQAIGMDGFHRRQEYLLSHTTIRDGQEIKMVEIKGAPVTFDLEALRKRIEMVLSGGSIGWPSYDRHLHNPVEDATVINRDIVLLEGNYLLLDEDGWRDLRDLADYTILVRADEDMLRKRLIDRKAKSGNSREKAEKFVDYSDMANVRLCLNKSLSADLELFINQDGDFCKRKP
ncbi:phosphoribulokinase/uridine kinase family protein [Butyrivibrio proteoclasticus B316]|uniref:Phosphoribulokinase/uridine kinase family protein n=1 Tax=Butyrivibrio proteoclasticus (strain ATCC 51982 / DSM 14932 / B316) TaxID=515622 RepID=E0S0Y9_BUTPB|nr:nucleoside/nucleotide kinase family protein [Butyrivibrio proteoclasticus]ADL33464.1 phosphoribulokinase/uridine kinase family protein [Butyrivibrio proteoclasticus B316]